MLLGFSGQGSVRGRQGCKGSPLRRCSLQMHYLTAWQQPIARVSSHPLLLGDSRLSLGPPHLGGSSLCVFPSVV